MFLTLPTPYVPRTSNVSFFMVDGVYDLSLRIKELRLLEAKLNRGIGIIYARVHDGSWFSDDITETLRLGLIGGGMSNMDAYNFVNTHVEAGNLKYFAEAAYVVLKHALLGDAKDQITEDEDSGEPPAPAKPPKTSTSSRSGRSSSSSPEPRTTRPRKSTK